MDNPKRNILLTGKPGVGKTTLVKKIIEALNRRAGGFYTEEIREGGQRLGFRIRTLDGKEGVLAHKEVKSSHKVGKYGVNLGDLEEIACDSIKRAMEKDEVVIIDEIGKMELYSKRFREVVIEALDSSKLVVATIGPQHIKFLDRIKVRNDVELLTITFDNRDKLAEEIRGKLAV